MKPLKRKKKSKKGFTLVELLGTLVILGIILGLAIPSLLNLKNDNKENKNEKYAESIIASGKLYTDSYAKDMFGNNTIGCYDITYSQLKEKNLAKDIKIDGITCDTYAEDGTPLTYVKVQKSNDNYNYELAIRCIDENNQIVYEKTVSGNGICDGTPSDEEGPIITLSPDGHTWYKGYKEGTTEPDEVTIKISDESGMRENIIIRYAWHKLGTAESTLTFNEKRFENNRYEGKTANPLETKIQVPQGETGEYELIIKTDSVYDAYGLSMTTSTIKSRPFQLDNTKPVIYNKTNDKDGIWTNDGTTISASGKDDHSGISKIHYTYTNSMSDLKNDWTTKTLSNANKNLTVLKKWTTERNSNVFVIAEDNAGNKSDIIPVGKIMIDKTKPQITKTTNSSNGAWTNNDVIITANATDASSGIQKIYYTYSNTASAEKSSNWKSDSITSVSGTWTTEMNNEVFIIAVDKAGNYSDYKSANYVRIDKTKPTITNVENPSGGNATTPGLKLTLTGKDNDGGSGINKWRYSYDQSSWNDYANSNVSPYTTTPFSTKRNQLVYISLCDKAGNCSDNKSTNVHIVGACDEGYTKISEYGTWSSCSEECGPGKKTRTNKLVSILDGSSCGTKKEESSCNLGTCGPPAHTCTVSLLGTTLKSCNWTLSCGTFHPKGYYGYCGICWNYGIKKRVGTSKYCPGKHKDGCKNYQTLFPTVVPD